MTSMKEVFFKVMATAPERIDTPTTYVPQATFDKFATYFYAIAGGIVIVLLIGFAGVLMTGYAIFQDSNNFKGATFENLKDQIINQNNTIKNQSDKIDILSTKISSMTYQISQSKIVAQ